MGTSGNGSSYQIASVTVDGVNQGALGSYTFTNVTASHTISATFAATGSYTLTVSVGTGATGTPGAGSYNYAAGSLVSYSYAAQSGYTALSVKLDGVTVAASGTVTMNASHALAVTATASGGSYTISGQVTSGGVGLTGATVSTNTGVSTTTDASGNYTLPGLANGTYTVTPSKAGYTFTPANRSVTVSGANVTGVSFTGSTGTSYSVSGKVTYKGIGQGSITIYCGTKTATTDGLGNYTVTGLVNGSYTVTPYYGSMTFYPIRTYVTVSGANVTGINFQVGRQVSGTVTLNGVGLASVTVATNTVVTTTTISNGTYILTGLAPATYTVTPSRAGYTFTPSSRSVLVATVNITGINFTATQTAAPVMGGGDNPGDTSGDTQPGGPMRPGEVGVYYGQDEEAGTMASPGAIEETAGETPGAAAYGAAYAEASEPVPAALQNLKATFYAWDHLGTIRLVSTADRTVMERHDYEPFGVELRPIFNQPANTHQYTGHERDQASGLDYMHARYYGGNLGRFLSPDKIAMMANRLLNPQKLNRYAYADNRPLIAVDPNGLDTFLFLYGQSNTPEGQRKLKGATDALASKVKAGPEDQVVVKSYYNADDIASATQERYSGGKIRNMTIVSHATTTPTSDQPGDGPPNRIAGYAFEARTDQNPSKQVVLDQQSAVDAQALSSSIDTSNFTGDATLTIIACDGGVGGKDSLAAQVAIATGIQTTSANGLVSSDQPCNGKNAVPTFIPVTYDSSGEKMP